MPQGTEGRYGVPARDESAERIQELGKRLVTTLCKNFKLSQTFDRQNKAMARPVRDLLELNSELNSLDDRWVLKLRKDYLHLCDVRLRVEVDLFLSYHYVLDEFKRRNLASAAFSSRAGAEDLLDFLYAFREAGLVPPGEDPFQRLHEGLGEREDPVVLVSPLLEGDTALVYSPEDVRQRSFATFFKAVYLTRGILSTVRTQRVMNVRRAKRLVTSLVDILSLDESTLLGLTNIKNFDDYTYNHSVNVCVLSLAVGRRLGLKRRQLSELGLSALFHDLGKTTLPSSLLNKQGKLDREELERLRRHPVDGVKQIITLKGLSKVTAKLIISVFRHHNNHDGSGYSVLREDEEQSLYSRIIRIADSYDAMTSKRIYRRGHKNNTEAVEELWSLAGSHFDPVLLKVFITTVGIYPVGTLVQLNSGEIAVVTRNTGRNEDLLTPVVRTLGTWERQPHEPATIDLSRQTGIKIYGYFQGSEADALLPSLLL
jgi:HD-GYP domain-containing protein (c-di-GMP phosphodiesterase class II)